MPDLRMELALLVLASSGLAISCSGRRAATSVPAPTSAGVSKATAAETPDGADGAGRRDEVEEEHDHPDQAAAFFKMQRWQGPGDLPAERYLTAREHARSMPRVALATGLPRVVRDEKTVKFGAWTPLGPGNVGGRVRGIAIDPNQPNTIYAGTATGGVWKTTDGGKTWTPLTDFLPVLSVGSLIMDPSDSQTLYLGTGEDSRGAGIFKTSDGGQTWTQLAETATPDFYYVNALAIPASRPTHIYAATSTGVFFSADAGATWNRTTTNSTFGCDGVKVRSDQPTDIVFAGCVTLVNNAASYAIYQNKDAGGEGVWAMVQSDPHMSSTAISIAPSKPDTVYAVSVTNDLVGPFRGALLAVYRSTQGGDVGTWQVQANTADPASVEANLLSYPSCTYPGNDHHGQGGYNLDIAVDPVDPDVVFVAGIAVFRSNDGGVTWGWANGGVSNGYVDQHILKFHPGYDGQSNQTLFLGNDGGMYRTDVARAATLRGAQALCPNSANPAIQWTSLNNNFTPTQFYHGAVLPGGATYYGGTQDHGTPLGSDFFGLNGWIPLFGGDGGQVAADPLDPNTLFYEYVYLSLEKSTDGGMSSRQVTTGITEDPKNNFNFITHYTQDPQDPLKMYIGGTQLWRSFDGGEHWTAASAATASTHIGKDLISVIAVDPFDADHVLFGTNAGSIYRNARALISTGSDALPSDAPRPGYVSRIAFDPHHQYTVYASYSTFRLNPSQSQIYRSDDGGMTWTAIGNIGSGALPDIPVNSILVDPDDSAGLYLGTDIGLFASFDSGQTWTRDDSPFADVITQTLIMEHEGTAKYLYAFTYGRGVWRLNLSGGTPSCSYAVSNSTISVDASENIGSVKVNTDPSCSWSVRPGSSFVTIQSPAAGKGPGTAFFKVNYNATAGVRSDIFYVQNQPVKVTQAGDSTGSHLQRNDELATAKVIPSLPYADSSFNSGYTSNAADPVHSCTNSKDYLTQWWKYTASVNAQILASVSVVTFVSADSEVTITAYSSRNGALAELGCQAVKAGADPAARSIQFNVQAGSSYVIEISSIDNSPSPVSLEVVFSPSVSLSPSAPALLAGEKQQFSVNVLNTANTAVRWILTPPVGTLDSSGVYTAPTLIDSPTVVRVIARSFANPVISASATVTVQPPPVAFSAAGVASAASYQSGGVSPGEIIIIFGTRLGPTDLAQLQIDVSGKVATTLGGTQVLFDGVPAPLIYSYTGFTSVLVPYEVAGKTSTKMQVTHNGAASSIITVPVADAVPALFTLDASGSGPAAISNQDGLVNSSQFAAYRGSIVALYGTGEGQTVPAGVDGVVANTVFPKPVLPVSATIGGKAAEVTYAGAAPGDVAGVIQVNMRVPLDVQPGDVPVVLSVGNYSSRSDVTMSVLGPDGRSARVAYANTGITDVSIIVYNPAALDTPIVLGTVRPGQSIYVGSRVVGNDWLIQVNSSPVRVISQVCSFVPSGSPPYWFCTGSAATPFPR